MARIDAFFCTAGVETTVIGELAKQCGIRLISLDEKTLSKLTRSYDFYSEYLIPAGTYEGQEEEARTLGVKAVLLAGDKLSSAQVKEITKILFDSKEKIQYALPVDISLDETTAVEGITIPFHKEQLHIMRTAVWIWKTRQRKEANEDSAGYVSDHCSCSAGSDAWKIFET
ncbi:MAG: TAXI family TRAP transporter solute-binding subunit [Blautia sp.]